MTYTLIVVFLLTGQAFVERRGLSLQACAGQAAMTRSDFQISGLQKKIGDARFFCVPETNG